MERLLLIWVVLSREWTEGSAGPCTIRKYRRTDQQGQKQGQRARAVLMGTGEGPAGACSLARQSWGAAEPFLRAGRQEPLAGKERSRVTAPSHPCTLVSGATPILFGFECLRIVLEGNTDSFFKIFRGTEQTGLSSFRQAAPLQGGTVVGCRVGGQRMSISPLPPSLASSSQCV